MRLQEHVKDGHSEEAQHQVKSVDHRIAVKNHHEGRCHVAAAVTKKAMAYVHSASILPVQELFLVSTKIVGGVLAQDHVLSVHENRVARTGLHAHSQKTHRKRSISNTGRIFSTLGSSLFPCHDVGLHSEGQIVAQHMQATHFSRPSSLLFRRLSPAPALEMGRFCSGH